MERSTSVGVALARTRAGRALRRQQTGSSWRSSPRSARAATSSTSRSSPRSSSGSTCDHRLAAVCSFLVAVTNNYTWNRLWTFHGDRGHVGVPGHALLLRRAAGAGREPRRARGADRARPGRGRRPGDRDRARHADQLRRQQALDVSKKTLTRFLRYGILAAALAWPSVADAATTPTGPVFDGQGNLVQTPFIPAPEPARLSERARRAHLPRLPEGPGLARPLPDERPNDPGRLRRRGRGPGRSTCGGARRARSPTGRVDDRSGLVTEAWTGPQVAWKMARGGRRRLRRPRRSTSRSSGSASAWSSWSGSPISRRPLSLRNLDLLVLLSFSVSLWFFNRGDIFTSVPLAYPPLLYVIARMAWIGTTATPRTARAPSGRSGCWSRRRSSSRASASG